MSGYAAGEQGLPAGARFVGKPFSGEALLRAVGDALAPPVR